MSEFTKEQKKEIKHIVGMAILVELFLIASAIVVGHFLFFSIQFIF